MKRKTPRKNNGTKNPDKNPLAPWLESRRRKNRALLVLLLLFVGVVYVMSIVKYL